MGRDPRNLSRAPRGSTYMLHSGIESDSRGRKRKARTDSPVLAWKRRCTARWRRRSRAGSRDPPKKKKHAAGSIESAGADQIRGVRGGTGDRRGQLGEKLEAVVLTEMATPASSSLRSDAGSSSDLGGDGGCRSLEPRGWPSCSAVQKQAAI
jgi:hypothetical protein